MGDNEQRSSSSFVIKVCSHGDDTSSKPYPVKPVLLSTTASSKTDEELLVQALEAGVSELGSGVIYPRCESDAPMKPRAGGLGQPDGQDPAAATTPVRPSTDATEPHCLARKLF